MIPSPCWTRWMKWRSCLSELVYQISDKKDYTDWLTWKLLLDGYESFLKHRFYLRRWSFCITWPIWLKTLMEDTPIVALHWWGMFWESFVNLKYDSNSIYVVEVLERNVIGSVQEMSFTLRWQHMRAMASQSTGNITVCSTVCFKGNTQVLHYWAFTRGIHWWTVDSHHKRPVIQKVCPCYDVTSGPFTNMD